MNMEEGITVLSLFDGMSCGQIALQKIGIKVKQYYAAEIDKHAIKATLYNFPNGISPTLLAQMSCKTHKILDFQRIRRLTPIECCRLQTVPDDYFKDEAGKNIISDTQQYRCLGNGWTIDVIAHIFSYLK